MIKYLTLLLLLVSCADKQKQLVEEKDIKSKVSLIKDQFETDQQINHITLASCQWSYDFDLYCNNTINSTVNNTVIKKQVNYACNLNNCWWRYVE